MFVVVWNKELKLFALCSCRWWDKEQHADVPLTFAWRSWWVMKGFCWTYVVRIAGYHLCLGHSKCPLFCAYIILQIHLPKPNHHWAPRHATGLLRVPLIYITGLEWTWWMIMMEIQIRTWWIAPHDCRGDKPFNPLLLKTLQHLFEHNHAEGRDWECFRHRTCSYPDHGSQDR